MPSVFARQYSVFVPGSRQRSRAAYLVLGESDQMKAQIRSSDRLPYYGTLIRALQGKLDKARGPLEALHQLRNEFTEVTHPGTAPTAETVTTANTNFANGAKVLLGSLQQATRPKG
jgi:hypothetical protein